MKLNFVKQNFKYLTLFLLIIFLMGIVGGCASSEQPIGGQQDPQVQDPQVKEEKPFYEGEVVTIIVCTAEGGGYDTYGRLVASHIGKYLPGSTVIVKNIPGAGHIVGANQLYFSEPDGLTFGIFNQGLITAQLIGAEGIKFDLNNMTWLANACSEPRVLMLGVNAPFKDFEDVIKNNSTQQLILSAAGVGSSSYVDAKLITEMMGLDANIVVGYEGTDAEMAMMRGEVHGTVGTADSMLPLATAGEAFPALAIYKSPLKDFPDVPLLQDIVPADRKGLAAFLISQASISRPFAGPPGIPEDRVKILAEAFEKTLKDPDLLNDAEKLKRPINFFSAEEVEGLVKTALNQPPEVIELLKSIVEID